MSAGMRRHHLKDITIPKSPGADYGTVVRLWSSTTPEEDDKNADWHLGPTWVEFCVIDYSTWSDAKGQTGLSYQTKGAISSPDPTDDIDNAEEIIAGFVKWDGCTQFTADIHVDHHKDLIDIMLATTLARREAAKIMGGMIEEEYQ